MSEPQTCPAITTLVEIMRWCRRHDNFAVVGQVSEGIKRCVRVCPVARHIASEYGVLEEETREYKKSPDAGAKQNGAGVGPGQP